MKLPAALAAFAALGARSGLTVFLSRVGLRLHATKLATTSSTEIGSKLKGL